MGRIDDHDDLTIEKFEPIKEWILQRQIKLRLKKKHAVGQGQVF